MLPVPPLTRNGANEMRKMSQLASNLLPALVAALLTGGNSAGLIGLGGAKCRSNSGPTGTKKSAKKRNKAYACGR